MPAWDIRGHFNTRDRGGKCRDLIGCARPRHRIPWGVLDQEGGTILWGGTTDDSRCAFARFGGTGESETAPE